MAHFPRVQAKAQAELDAVLGSNHTLTPDDKKDLPYMCALIKEIMRYHPVMVCVLVSFRSLVVLNGFP